MDTFRIDYDKLDVETIMAQIRQQVREKKGVLYTDEELGKLRELKLPSPVPPEHKDPDRDATPLPEVPEIDLQRRITERMKELQLDDVKDTEFITEALRCVGEWNVNISVEDLYRSTPNFRGRVIKAIRSFTRKLFKLVMNIDVLFPQFHRQAQLNQTYVVLLHTLVQEISLLNNGLHRLRHDLTNNMIEINDELSNSLSQVDADLKRTRAELLRDIATDKNDFRRGYNTLDENLQQLDYKLDGLRGLLEGQRHQLEYIQARQQALEQLAVLKKEKPEDAGRKTTEIPRGRYRPKKS